MHVLLLKAPYLQVEIKGRPSEGSADHEHPSSREVVPNVYALGDCCASATQPLPALAQVLHPSGSHTCLSHAHARAKVTEFCHKSVLSKEHP